MDSPAKLLVVDRDSPSRSAKVHLLEEAGLNASAVEPESAALQGFEPFDLVILDALDGATPAFCKTIKEQSPSTSILCIARTKEDVAPTVSAAADGFLLE